MSTVKAALAQKSGPLIHGVHTHTLPHSSAGDRRRQLREPVGRPSPVKPPTRMRNSAYPSPW